MSHELIEVTAPAAEEKRQERLPLLLWPIVFRFALVAVFTAWFAPEIARDRDWPLLLVVLGILVMPSLLIAMGLVCRQAWAYWLAVCGDCTIAALGTGQTVGEISPHAYGATHAFAASEATLLAIGALSLIEGLYLLLKQRQSLAVLLAYLLTAFFSVVFGRDLVLLGD